MPSSSPLESVTQYLRQDSEGQWTGFGGGARPNIETEKFEDYLESQKASRDRRRRLYYGGHGGEEPYWQQYKAHMGEEAPDSPVSTRSLSSTTFRRRHVHQPTFDALQVLGRRQNSISQDWQAFLSSRSDHTSRDEEEGETAINKKSSFNADAYKKDNKKHDANNKQKDDSESKVKLMLPWYCRPVQRQLWGDDQVLPHINWHDLFFDLIFVAAAYNLGVMLVTTMNQYDWPRGVLYFIAIFGPLYTIWENDVVYHSRYTLVDYSHRIVAVLRFLFVSFAVLSIKQVKLLGDPHSAETFCLVLSLFCESLIQLGLNLELYWYGDGDRKAIQNQTRRETITQILPTSMAYLEATVVAGRSLFNENGPWRFTGSNSASNSNYDHHRRLGGGEEAYSSNSSYNEEHYSAGHHGVQWSYADIPLFLCFLSYVFSNASVLYQRSTRNKKKQDIRDFFVPNNIDYIIHRHGEWILLMIGESILSLLIVETTEAKEYYAIEWLGCLTVIIIQMIKFESRPDRADGHALWRSMTAATIFSILIQVISMALIAFGVSFKLMLQDVLRDEKMGADAQHRELAETPQVTEKADAWLFCLSLSVVLTCMELMMITHRGIGDSYQLIFRIPRENPHKWSWNWPVILTTILKVGIIGFTATLETWMTDPFHIAIAGFLIATSMAVTRVLSWGFINHEEYINEAVTSLSRRVTSLVATTKTSTLETTQEEEGEEEEIVFDSASYMDQRRESLLKIPVDNVEWKLAKQDNTE